jgi:hypothetical protein
MSIEKKISYLIEKDFPNYYREEGPVFVEFIRTYYEWLESQDQTIYHARNLMDYQDIDTTIDDFIVYFKKKYLPNVQFDTATDVQQLVKHTLDLYRSKGTARSIDLFFRLVYGKPASIYYPSDDIFRLSDGKWIKPVYLEITSSPANRIFINKQIIGLTSGATAFVEKIIRRKIASKYAEIMFISSVNGNFQTGEKITIDGDFQQENPTVLGSLSTLDVIVGGQNFAIGDIVNLVSDNGVQGKARVSDISNYTGLVDFILVDGGWGYTANAEVLVSEKILTISNVTPVINSSTPFGPFEKLYQPLANITYDAANSSFAANDVLVSYFSNGMMAGSARVLTSANTSASNGTLLVSITNGAFGFVSERNVNSSATVVVSRFSNTITGVKHNTNLTGTVNAILGHRNVLGTGTFLDRDLFLPQANLTGTVSVNATSNSVIGTGTIFDMEFMKPQSNLVGSVYVNTTSLAVLGINTTFTEQLNVGEYITIFANATNWQSRKIDSITNSTVLAVNSMFTMDNATANYTKSLMSPHVAVYTNSSYHQSRAIHEVVNSTLLTVTTRFNAQNSSSQYANSYMAEWVSFSNGSYREIRSVNNVVNSTSMWLKWPHEFANATASIGNVTPSDTKFYIPFVNATGTATFSTGNLVVLGSGTNFNDYSNGEFIALYTNATSYEIKTIDVVTNSTYLTLTNVASVSNSSGITANVTANDAIYFGKTIILFANSTRPIPVVVESVANDSTLTINTRPDFANSATVFANSLVLSTFYKSGNSAVANAVSYQDLTATANVIGTKANVQLFVTNNSISFANDMIVYQTNSAGSETASALVISTSFIGTNTFLVVDTVVGSFMPNTHLKSRYANGLAATSNGVLTEIQYQVGVVDIANVFKVDEGNFVYTTGYTTGTVTKVSQHNVLAGFDISSNSLNYEETITLYDDMIEPYADVYLNAENFQPAGLNLTSNLALANVDTTLMDAFTNTTITIGGINRLLALNPGTNYDTSPIVVIYEPQIAPANKLDFILYISNSVGAFTAGEVLVQNSTSVGILKEANSSVLKVKRINYEVPFNLSLAIDGVASGSSANINLVGVDITLPPIGLNANVQANVVTGSGSVSGLEVVDSGVGYVDRETVVFVSSDRERAGLAVVNLEKQGVAEGYYASKGGFISADKKIFDGHYYQEYSYEIRSPVTLDKYESMLRNVLHIAGTKFFASVVTPSIGSLAVIAKETNLGISGRIIANTYVGNSVVLTSNTGMLRVGDGVTGTGIGTNRTIVAINSTSFTMSNTSPSTRVDTTVTYTR